ncbi:carbohydrate ABC transporter permease [Arthrobacter sp. SO3]|uniref:carbohydrate ABC transporter permease n=1 Tax=Arthrobacter sp. SO3 TaxID=1897057 RepID=UPI001CFF8844|nr:carbohydrate ABC transporter permease [Arthrobacter sp. SO3]
MISAVFSLPFLWALLTAIKPFRDAFTFPPTWNFTPTIDSFSKLYLETDFVAIFGNTVLVAVLTMVISLAIAAPAAYAMSRHSGKIGIWLLIIALVFRALPRFAVVLPFYDIAQALGVYDSPGMLIIALVAVNQPFTLWLLRNFFATIPASLDEAAQIDGCGPLRTFFRVILPLSVPGLATAGIFTLLLAYQEYLIPLALTQTNAQTISVFVSSIGAKQNVSSLQTLAACNVALAIPVVFLALFAQRYLVSGLTAGSEK